MFKSPMLAKEYDPARLTFPRIGSVKLDGWRAVNHGSVMTTRSGKPIRNLHTQRTFSHPWLEGLDGEVIVGAYNEQETFNRTDSGMKTEAGEPDVTFYVFDHYNMPGAPYEEREECAKYNIDQFYKSVDIETAERVIWLPQHEIVDEDSLDEFEAKAFDDCFEGVMLRRPGSIYKYGRCSATPGSDHLLKVKRFVDAEATIIRFEERMINGNVAFTNELGRTKRASNAENLRSSGMVGSAWVKSPRWEKEFKVGCGTLGHAGAAEWFQNQEKYIGQQVVFKYLPHGVKDVPRHGILKGLRAVEDSATVG